MFNCGGEGGFYAKFVNIYDFKGLTIIGLPHLYHPFVATAGSIPRWGFEMRTISPEILPDGNPHKLPRMVPTRDWAPPLVSYPPFHDGNGHQPRSGPGPASLLERYGKRKRSINSGVPFGKG